MKWLMKMKKIKRKKKKIQIKYYPQKNLKSLIWKKVLLSYIIIFFYHSAIIFFKNNIKKKIIYLYLYIKIDSELITISFIIVKTKRNSYN